MYGVFLELNQADWADGLVEAERGQLVPGGLCSTEPVLGQARSMGVWRGLVGPRFGSESLASGLLDSSE